MSMTQPLVSSIILFVILHSSFNDLSYFHASFYFDVSCMPRHHTGHAYFMDEILAFNLSVTELSDLLYG